MGQIIEQASLDYYVDLLKALASRGAILKSGSVARFNPIGTFEELQTDKALDDITKIVLPEYHIISVIEHANPSGLVNYSERYHFWQASGKNGVKTWIDIDGHINTYNGRSFGITDAFGRFVRGLRRKP